MTDKNTVVRKITWKPFYEALKAAGVLPDPDHTTRIVIDAKVGSLVTITYYTFADDRVLNALGEIEYTDDPDKSLVR